MKMQFVGPSVEWLSYWLTEIPLNGWRYLFLLSFATISLIKWHFHHVPFRSFKYHRRQPHNRFDYDVCCIRPRRHCIDTFALRSTSQRNVQLQKCIFGGKTTNIIRQNQLFTWYSNQCHGTNLFNAEKLILQSNTCQIIFLLFGGTFSNLWRLY